MKELKIANNTTMIWLIALLLILPVALTVGQPPQFNKTSRIPDIPRESLKVNRTDLIPVNFKYRVEKGEPSALSFKNLLLEINSTKNIDLETTVGQGVPIQYIELDLEPGESLGLKINIDVEPPAQAFQANDSIGVYLSLQPNSTEHLRSRIRLFIDEEAIKEQHGRGINPMALSWAYWNGTGWETVESWLDEEGYLVAEMEHLSSWTIREAGRPIKAPDIPGLPKETRAHNYTDTVPKGFTWRVREREPVALLFRNMTMICNASKELHLNMTVDQRVVNKTFRLNVSPGGSLSLDINIDVGPPSGVTALEKNIGVYMDVEPNATEEMYADLSLLIDEEEIKSELGQDVNISRLSWAYWDEDHWVFVDSVMDETGYLNAKTSHFSTWTIAERPTPTKPEPVPKPDIPGVPDNAVAYNYSDTIPLDFEWSLKEREPVVLSFKNLVLIVNPSKAVDIKLNVGSNVAEHVFQLSLNPSESIKVDVNVSVDPPSGVEEAHRDIDLYFEIEPNKTTQVDANLSLLIDEERIESNINRDINISRLSWAHWDGEAWMPVESNIDENGYLNAETSHFSTWTVLEKEAVQPTPEPSPGIPSGIWLWGIGILVLVVIILVIQRR
ncbi:MAG: hypothetical protein ACLFVP_00050 [Candidatus Bathyarchaeia archaeon]